MLDLVLDVPDDVYKALADTAQQQGQTPEVLAMRWLAEKAGNGAESDPLEKWIGALDTDVVGWADEHDRYIGEALHASMHVPRAALAQKRPLVTTNYIIAELVALLTSRLHVPRATAIQRVPDLRTSPYLQVIYIDPMLEERLAVDGRTPSSRTWSLCAVVRYAEW